MGTNIHDPLCLTDTIDYILWDKDGRVKDQGHLVNQVQTLCKEIVVDALDTGTITAINWMAVGTGAGQNVAAAALSSKVSNEVLTAQTQPTSVTLQNVTTFTAITGTVTEAGLFNVAACTSGMQTYTDSLNVVMTSSDTLQLTWTITVS